MQINKKILVIDDSQTNLLLIEDILSEEGYNIIPVSDPKKGIGLVHTLHPDIIILDIMMPQMDGFEFFEKIKPYNIPVIMISAKTDMITIKKSREIGVFDFIKKPVKIDVLKNKVKQVFENQNIQCDNKCYNNGK